jgi:hypothetical protein
MPQPADFPVSAKGELFQNVPLLMLVKLAPGTIDLGSGMNRMGTEALIGLGNVFLALLAYAVHLGSLLFDTSR